jgi:hypothetical protein
VLLLRLLWIFSFERNQSITESLRK